MLDRIKIVPFFCMALLGYIWLVIFKVNVPDALGKAIEGLQYSVAAVHTRAKRIMAGIEHQTQYVRIG